MQKFTTVSKNQSHKHQCCYDRYCKLHDSYGVHGIDPLYEGNRDSSCKEINEGIFVSDFTEGDVVFELGDVISEGWGF